MTYALLYSQVCVLYLQPTLFLLFKTLRNNSLTKLVPDGEKKLQIAPPCYDVLNGHEKHRQI